MKLFYYIYGVSLLGSLGNRLVLLTLPKSKYNIRILSLHLKHHYLLLTITICNSNVSLNILSKITYFFDLGCRYPSA